MTIRNLFVFQAIAALFNGAGLVLMTETYASIYGVSLADKDAIFMAQLLGAALLSYGFVAWFARDAGASDARSAIVLGFFLSLAIGFVFALLAQLSGVLNTLGWVIVGLYFLLALGFGYFQFVKSDTA